MKNVLERAEENKAEEKSGFGVHLEKRPHRFDQLWARSPGEWEMWMHYVDKLPDGTWYGWGHVLDYIGVEWREPWREFEKQESLFERMRG